MRYFIFSVKACRLRKSGRVRKIAMVFRREGMVRCLGKLYASAGAKVYFPAGA